MKNVFKIMAIIMFSIIMTTDYAFSEISVYDLESYTTQIVLYGQAASKSNIKSAGKSLNPVNTYYDTKIEGADYDSIRNWTVTINTHTLLEKHEIESVISNKENTLNNSIENAKKFSQEVKTYADEKYSSLDKKINDLNKNVTDAVKTLTDTLVTDKIVEAVQKKISEQLAKEMASIKEQLKAELFEALKNK